jgi:hypothetical protein
MRPSDATNLQGAATNAATRDEAGKHQIDEDEAMTWVLPVPF